MMKYDRGEKMNTFLFLYGLTAHAFVPKVSDNGSDLHWGVSEVSYYINFDGDHELTDEEIEEAITQSSDAWKPSTNSQGDFKFFYEGESKERYANSDDDEFVVSFRDNWTKDPNVLAYAFVWSIESSNGENDGEIIHFDIEINSDHHTWATDGRADAYDLANAITHEFGHSLGLAHSEDVESTMFETVEIGETHKRDVNADDLEGYDHLYTSDGIASNDDNTIDENENSEESGGDGNAVFSDNGNSSSGSSSSIVPVENSGCSQMPMGNYLLFLVPLLLYRRDR